MAYIRIEQPSAEEYRYGQNRIAINRGEKLSIQGNVDRTEKLWMEQKSYRQKKMAIDRIERLPIDQNGYQKNRIAINRTEIENI